MQQTPILTVTRVCAAAMGAHLFVARGAAGPCAAGAKPLGVSGCAAAVGDAFPVHALGTAKVVAGAVIADGAEIEVGANGKAITKAAGVSAAIALQAATAADQIIEVLLIP